MPDQKIVRDFSDMPMLRNIGLEKWGMPKNWGVCIVGTGLEDQGVREGMRCVKHVTFQGDDVVETFYPIPDNVVVLIESEKQFAVREKLAMIRAELSIE